METGNAKNVSQEDLQRCAELPTTELKLVCFEALVTPVPEVAEEQASEPEATAPREETVQPAEIAEAPEPDLQADLASSSSVPVPAATASVAVSAGQPASDSAEPEPEPESAKSMADSVRDEAPAVTITAASATTAVATDTGSANKEESRKQEAPEDATMVAIVNKVVRGDRRRLVFYFENGQVWRQSNSDYMTYPKNEPFEVEITKGMMGDYRLRVGGEGRMSRIVRIE